MHLDVVDLDSLDSSDNLAVVDSDSVDVVLAVGVVLAAVEYYPTSFHLLVSKENLEVETLLVEHLALQQDVRLDQAQILFPIIERVPPLPLTWCNIHIALG